MRELNCSNCGRGYEVIEKGVGNEVSCKECGNNLIVPSMKPTFEKLCDTTIEVYDLLLNRMFKHFKALSQHERVAPAIEI